MARILASPLLLGENYFGELPNSEKSPLPLLMSPLTLPFPIAMLAHNACQPVVDKFHPLGAELVVNAQEAPINELTQQGLSECALVQRILQRITIAKTAFGDQSVLDKAPSLVRHIDDTALVEVADNGRSRSPSAARRR